MRIISVAERMNKHFLNIQSIEKNKNMCYYVFRQKNNKKPQEE